MPQRGRQGLGGERTEELGAQLCPTLTHHPLGVLGRAHFFEVVSDL